MKILRTINKWLHKSQTEAEYHRYLEIEYGIKSQPDVIPVTFPPYVLTPTK